MKNVSWKLILIILGIVFAIILLFTGIFVSVSNNTIILEEQIKESKSAIKVQEKRRFDLIGNLVDTVKSYNKYENETLNAVTQARTKLDNGDLDGAKNIINAVVEKYPDLKSNENYKQVMLEMATTENLVAEYRENYNTQVKSYNKSIKKFPNNIILRVIGYENKNYKYLDYNVSEDSPKKLWD